MSSPRLRLVEEPSNPMFAMEGAASCLSCRMSILAVQFGPGEGGLYRANPTSRQLDRIATQAARWMRSNAGHGSQVMSVGTADGARHDCQGALPADRVVLDRLRRSVSRVFPGWASGCEEIFSGRYQLKTRVDVLPRSGKLFVELSHRRPPRPWVPATAAMDASEIEGLDDDQLDEEVRFMLCDLAGVIRRHFGEGRRP